MPLKTIEGNLKSSTKNQPISYRMLLPENLEKPAPAVVFVPGFGSSLQTSDYIQESLTHIAQSGVVAIGFNYSHIEVKKNGKVKTGKLTCDNADDDFRRVLDFARNSDMVDAKKIVGMGCSFGGHTLFRNNDSDLAGYIGLSLVPDFQKPFEHELTAGKERWWRFFQEKLNRGIFREIDDTIQEINYHLFDQSRKVDLKEKISAIKQPITLIQGTKDPLASVEAIEELRRCMTNSVDATVHFLEDAGHKFTGTVLSRAVSYAGDTLSKVFSDNKPNITLPVANDNPQPVIGSYPQYDSSDMKLANG